MSEQENKFLHSINLDALKKETGKTIEEIAKLVGIGPKVVYKWQYMHKDGSRPTGLSALKAGKARSHSVKNKMLLFRGRIASPNLY